MPPACHPVSNTQANNIRAGVFYLDKNLVFVNYGFWKVFDRNLTRLQKKTAALIVSLIGFIIPVVQSLSQPKIILPGFVLAAWCDIVDRL